MKELKKLPIGTKLMWDASPNVYLSGLKQGELIIYPATIVDQHQSNKALGAKIKTGHKASWMGNENENLRLPTQEELDKYEWPEA